MPELTSSSDRNLAIEGLRGLLALLVVGIHILKMAAKVHLVVIYGNVADYLGPYRASLFFAISGFFTLQTLLRNGDLKHFAWRRFARIYPLFLLLHFFLFTIGPLANYEWMGHLRHDLFAYISSFLSNALLLPGIFELPLAQKNAWTLSYEAAFYLLTGLAFFISTSMFGIRQKIAFLALLIASSFLLFYRPCSIFFLVGILSYWAFSKKKVRIPNLYLGGPIGLLSALAGWALFPVSIVASSIATLPFFYSVIQRSGWHSDLLATRLPTFLGRISYSLYLLHPFVLGSLRQASLHLLKPFGPPTSFIAFALVGVGVSIAAATVSYELVEKRLTKLLNRPSVAERRMPVPSPAIGSMPSVTSLDGFSARA